MKSITMKHLRIYGAILAVVCFYITYLNIARGKNSFEIFVFVVMFLFSIAMYFLHLKISKDMMKNTLAIHNGIIPESIFRFGENTITFEEGKTFMEFDYSQIKRIYELKKLYVLMIGKQNGIIIRKDSFSVGTFHKFKEFIGRKCKNIKK
ncbi:MAG: YcxB family protein [Fusobacterium sp.]|nr:YcxB family protein [Fusobacterium sp.]